MATTECDLKIEQITSGRALFITATDRLYICRGYSILRSDNGGANWELDCHVPCVGWKPLVAKFLIGARLLRFNIQALQVLEDGTRVAVARDGIYRADAGDIEMRRTWCLTRGSRPINLAADGKTLLFGEYGGPEMDTLQVRIYLSTDAGRHFAPVYEFPKGDIHHIHNVVVDRFANHYWVFAGDHGAMPGIGILTKDGHFSWAARSSQMVRVVSALVRADCLLFGSDSEVEQNFIVRFDKKTGQYEKIVPVEGSSLYASDFGRMGMKSTCVEPSKVNKGNKSCLYASADGRHWQRIVTLKKDCWDPVLFQFGLIVLPYVQAQNPKRGMYSGQALVKQHDRTTIFSTNSKSAILGL
jgi:hypothetical protein